MKKIGFADFCAPYQENNMEDCPKEFLKYLYHNGKTGDREYYESEEEAKKAIGDSFDPEEGYYENPNAKRDRYQLGGRYAGRLRLKEKTKEMPGFSRGRDKESIAEKSDGWRADYATVKDIDREKMEGFSTFAVLKDGKRYERGEMGRRGMVKDEKEEGVREEEFKKLLEGLSPDTVLAVVDYHI